ncbi:MAG: hypothetical protein B7Z30_13755 [Rhizobiales bacterium 12-68-15]|nr:MAG: hypothetical protein B7Z30_13755 [Rhizobiales bacterium 12-68-15]
MTDAVIGEEDLSLLATQALVSGGMRAEDAQRVARVLVLADLFGLRTHGVSRVAQYLDRVRVGGIDAQAEVATSRVAPGLSLVDGANGMGSLVGMRALEAALDSAREVGIGAAFARASNHFGPIMPYALIAAEAGFASIIGTNATTWDKQPEAHQDLGHFFILIDTTRLADPKDLARRVGDFKDIIRSTPAADPEKPVRLPGDMEFALLHRQRRDGIAVAAEDLAALTALAGR